MTYFNVLQGETVSPAVAVNTVPAAHEAENPSPNLAHLSTKDFDEINSRALRHFIDTFEQLGLPDSYPYPDNKFVCPSPFGKNPDELLEVNIFTGAWVDHGEYQAKGLGIIDLKAHLEGYTPMEAATLLNEYLDEYHPAYPRLSNVTNRLDLIEIDAQALDLAVEIFPAYLHFAEEGQIQGNEYVANSVYLGLSKINLKTASWSVKRADDEAQVISGHGVISYLAYMNGDSIMETAWALNYWLHERFQCAPEVVWGRHQNNRSTDTSSLFGLELLRQNPDDAVLLSIGEQAGYAGRFLLPGYASVAVSSGADIEKVDFSPLKGRTVFIWADHGEARRKKGVAIADILLKMDMLANVYLLKSLMYLPEWLEDLSTDPLTRKSVDGCNLFGLKVRTETLPDGYNASHALADGWTSGYYSEVFLKLIQRVKPVGERKPNIIVHAGDKLSKKEHVDNIVAKFDGFLQYVNAEPYTYKDGHWLMLNERVEVEQLIAHYLGEKVSKTVISELLTLVQIFQARAEQAVAANLNLVCLLNGTLNTRTGALHPYNPDHNLKNQINCDWNPLASCKRWLQFLDEIFVNDPDKAEKIQLLQEWFGYCMIPDNSQHKFLWLVGGGGNGKSVLLDILRLLVGLRYVSDAHIERLARPAVLAELENKLVNISSEMSAEATLSDSNFKAIVAGDYIEAERKFKTPFSFKPTVRMIGATNHLPRLLDLSDGFFRRAIILTFNRKFEDADRDTKLIDKLVAELPGILVWAVQGLKNLRERKMFVIPESSIEALAQYRNDSDPERMFFDECLILDTAGNGMSPNEIYAVYVVWCRASGYRPKAKNNFGKRLPDFGIDQHRGHSGKRWQVKPNPASNEVWNEARVCGISLATSPATEPVSIKTIGGHKF